VDAEAKSEIEAAIKEARESVTSENAEEIRSKTEALQAAFHKVSEQIYQAAQQQQAAANGASADGASAEGEADDEEVVDAEVVEDEGR
jgi:molecular chaperone DnaK